jgi:hypothetical protein
VWFVRRFGGLGRDSRQGPGEGGLGCNASRFRAAFAGQFLAADGEGSPLGLLLNAAEVEEFAAIVETAIRLYPEAVCDRRIAQDPAGLRRLVGYYRAHLGQGTFVAPPCNAPWASLFIEADGAVRPCFFRPPVGNLRERPLAELLADAMPAFRAGLDVATNAVCARCVCS